MPICSHRLLLFSIHVSCVLCVDTHNSGSISRALYESVPHRPTHRPVFYLLLPNLFLFSPRNDDDDDVPPPFHQERSHTKHGKGYIFQWPTITSNHIDKRGRGCKRRHRQRIYIYTYAAARKEERSKTKSGAQESVKFHISWREKYF